MAKLFADAGVICVTAFISPYRADRDVIRQSLPPGQFVEVYLNAPLEVCEQRDSKGLYAKARAGEIRDFTGVSAPYEPPANPELELPTGPAYGRGVRGSNHRIPRCPGESGLIVGSCRTRL